MELVISCEVCGLRIQWGEKGWTHIHCNGNERQSDYLIHKPVPVFEHRESMSKSSK